MESDNTTINNTNMTVQSPHNVDNSDRSNHLYLVGSSLLFIIPIAIFLMKKQKNVWEYVLCILLVINFILSLLFWSQPIQHSTIHFYDAIFGRISLFLFIFYIFFIKHFGSPGNLKLLSFIVLFFILILFYYSDVYSSKEWCSDNHIMCHFLFHMFISIGCSLAFY